MVNRMKLFSGPCSLESIEICYEVANTIRDSIPDNIDYYFKTSFAKENRSSSNSFVGPVSYTHLRAHET